MPLTARQLALLRSAGEKLTPTVGVEELLLRAARSLGAAPDGGAASSPSSPPGALRVVQGEAVCVELAVGDELRIAQVQGGQCADVLAWGVADPAERLSASATRARHGVSPTRGARLRSGWPHERELVEIVLDTAPGHDLLHPACSPAEYAAVGAEEEPSCASVQARAAEVWGLGPRDLHDPLNLWFRPCLGEGGALDWRPTATVPGDAVVLRALAEVRLVVNPCVDDVYGCSRVPRGALDVSTTAGRALRRVGTPVEVLAVAVTVDGAVVQAAGDRPAAAVRARALESALAALGHVGARGEEA